MSDKDIRNWDERLTNHVNFKWENYMRRRIHLDTARSNEMWPIAGEFIYIEEVSSNSAIASIRIDKSNNPVLDLSAGVEIETIFETLYLSHDAQAGEWMDIIIGINFKYRKPFSGDMAGQAEAQEVVVMTNGTANTNTVPAAQICNEVLIKTDVKNTGIVWFNFGTAAVQDSCIALDPGEWIRVSLSNLDQINANFEIASERAYIIYEL